jgi:LysR family transcriptional regulator, regulator for bpeEF and oprC
LENLGDIITLVRVVDSGSFVAAAQTLGVSPSAVSKSVSRLEQRLGVRLLNRTTRALSLTDAGNSFYTRCRSLVGQLQDAEDEATATNKNPRGRLRVDMPLSLARDYIVPALPRFLTQYPDISLQVSLTDRVVDMIEEGIDVVLRVGELTDSRLVARHLWTPEVMLVASPDYLARAGTPADPEDLNQHACVQFFNPNTGNAPEWIMIKDGVSKEATPASRLMFNSLDAILAAAAAGAGIAPTLAFLAERSLASGVLTRVLPDWRLADQRPISALYMKGKHPSPKVQAFIEFLVGLFPSSTRPVRRT